MRSLFFLIVCVLMAIGSFAQDPHFSQFFASPLTLNPALTGKFNGDVRIAGNYRNQWPTINNAFTTGTVSADFHILQNKISDVDTWGVGIMALTDQSAAGAVKFNYGAISTAFHKGLDENGYKQIGIGFQGTYSNMMINTSKLTFEDQLRPDGFTGITSETFNGSTLKKSYFDLNTGILFSSSVTERDNFYAGVSLYHVTRPRQQFTDTGYFVLNPRITLQAGGFLPVGELMTLHLSALHSIQAGAHETVVGGAMQIPAGDPETQENPVSFFAGLWYRLNDAFIPYVGLDYSNFSLGVTYDVNTSDLKTASNSRGGIEISLIYIKKPAENKGVPCPRF